ncbi:MAG TPA: hemerythrin domain-containing protein [Vicinamibacterales bacterium]|nr:hemerythrin domain-containing protein [Vicinamibacterales bacterium]
MFLKIGRQPDHTFAEPLGLLSDCHRRIEHFLSVLIAITERAGGGLLDADERAQFVGALSYFATAAPRHTADEEESLFPRLKSSNDPEATEVLAAVDRLEDDHAEASDHHATIDRCVRQWLAAGALPPHDLRSLQERLGRLSALYRTHIGIEDRQVFPAAARILSAGAIEEIGREMAARRRRPWQGDHPPHPDHP